MAHTLKLIWKSPTKGDIECKLIEDRGSYFVIQIHDPYDPGWIQLTVPQEQVLFVAVKV